MSIQDALNKYIAELEKDATDRLSLSKTGSPVTSMNEDITEGQIGTELKRIADRLKTIAASEEPNPFGEAGKRHRSGTVGELRTLIADLDDSMPYVCSGSDHSYYRAGASVVTAEKITSRDFSEYYEGYPAEGELVTVLSIR